MGDQRAVGVNDDSCDDSSCGDPVSGGLPKRPGGGNQPLSRIGDVAGGGRPDRT